MIRRGSRIIATSNSVLRSMRGQGTCFYRHHNIILSSDRYSSSRTANEDDDSTIMDIAKQNRLAQSRKMDPTAKRPNKVCDPYGQQGQPMTLETAQRMRQTMNLENDWQIIMKHKQDDSSSDTTPASLTREFAHASFLDGADFIRKMAAVALVHNHYPTLELDRCVRKKSWQVVSRITCHTKVLEGLSSFDFHLTMMMDIEINRPEVQKLILTRTDEAEKK